MKELVVILDPAHGIEVPGKRSPDGKHREYLWSRQRCAELETALKEVGFNVYFTTRSENEPGLSARKNVGTQTAPGKTKLFLSLHNNASGMGDEWKNARGISVWTTKGFTNADICADIFIENFHKDFPNLKVNQYSVKYGEKDFESNFTVLMGNGYMGVLIEWLFQDNIKDVEDLRNPEINARLIKSLVKSIEDIDNYFSKKK